MFRRLKSAFTLSSGEANLAVAYIGVAIFGAIMSFSVVNRLGGGNEIIRPMTSYDCWIILAGGIGAYSALFLGRTWLGHAGIGGYVRVLIAIPVISFIASIITGTLAFPGHGTMFAPLALVTTVIANPMLGILWGGMIVAAHFRFARWRTERDTIFQAAY